MLSERFRISEGLQPMGGYQSTSPPAFTPTAAKKAISATLSKLLIRIDHKLKEIEPFMNLIAFESALSPCYQCEFSYE